MAISFGLFTIINNLTLFFFSFIFLKKVLLPASRCPQRLPPQHRPSQLLPLPASAPPASALPASSGKNYRECGAAGALGRRWSPRSRQVRRRPGGREGKEAAGIDHRAHRDLSSSRGGGGLGRGVLGSPCCGVGWGGGAEPAPGTGAGAHVLRAPRRSSASGRRDNDIRHRRG